MRVLIAEDEPTVAQNVAQSIKAHGFVPHIVNNGEDAWFQGSTETFAGIVLDLGLPKLDGMTVLKRWRDEGMNAPVIILSARGTWAERVEGIDAGADDYLTKPFQLAELVSRLKALMRRGTGTAKNTIDIGALQIDLRNSSVSINGLPIALTPLEFRLLQHLGLNLGKTVSQIELADSLYAINNERDTYAVEAAVSRLRKKLGPDIICNKRGFGYFIPDTMVHKSANIS